MTPLRPTGWTTTDGATTRTSIITDEWAAQHLPLTQVALAAAVPIIEAEVRERIMRRIDALPTACDFGTVWRDDVVDIVRGES